MKKNEKSARRRPGRLRRWVLRPLVWTLVVLVVAVFAALRFLESDLFADRLAGYATERLGEALERPVTLDDLSLDLVPLGLRIDGFEIGGPSAAAPPFLRVERAFVEADLSALVRSRVELQHVRLEKPQVWIGFDDEGRADTPRFGGGGGGGGRTNWLRFGAVELVGGELMIDENRMPLDFAARDVEAAFNGVEAGLELRGRASAEDFGLRLPPGENYGGRFELSSVIRRQRLDITRAKIEGPDLTARASGIWRWFGDRELALQIEAEGDLEVLGRLGYLRNQLAGPFQFSGQLTRKPGVWMVDGDLESPTTRVFDRSLTAVRSRLQADSNSLRVEIADAMYGEGGVRGRVELGLAVDRGRVSVELELDRVRLARLVRDQAIPVTGLGGGVSGVFHYQFDQEEPRRGNGWADLSVADERSPRPAELRLSGTVPLLIGEGVVGSDAIRLTSTDLLLTATGSYDLAGKTGAYDFELETGRVGDVVRLIPEEVSDGDAPTGLWRPSTGRGRAQGTLSLAAGAAALRLRLDLQEVAAPGLRADRASGLLALDGGGIRELRLEFARPEAALLLEGSLPFEDPESGAELPPPPFSLALNAAGWPLEEARVWLPFELPISGPFTGVVELAGELESPTGILEGRLAPARWGEGSAESLSADGTFDARELRIGTAELAIAHGVIAASGVVQRETLELQAEFESTPLDPAELGLGAPLASGRLAVRGRVAGSLSEPELEGRLTWSEGAAGGDDGEGEEGAGEGEETAVLDVDWRGGQISVEGSLLGLARISGGGSLGPEEVAVELDLTDGRLERLAGLLAPPPAPPIDGTFAGRVEIGGRVSPEVDLTVRTVLDEVTARPRLEELVAEVPELSNLEPVVVELDSEGVRLRSVYLGDGDGGSEIFVGGLVSAAGALDLQVQLSVAGEWLGLVVGQVLPDARWSGGAFDAIATIEGEMAQPRINGVGEMRKARLVAEALPTSIDDLTATLLFYRDQVIIDRASARLAGGQVQAGGTVTLASETGDLSYSLQAAGERLSYRSSLGWTLRGSGSLALDSTPDGRQLSGSVSLDQAIYLEDVKLGLEQLLAAAFGRERLDVAPADDWLASTHLNLRVQGPEALRVRNNLADLRGDADLVVRGTLARPVVFGSVELEPGGSLDYAGVTYEVERGQLAFTNPYRIEPVVDLAARTELREYEITLAITGPPDRLVVNLSSNPPLADLDVLALLTGSGETPVTGSERTAEAGVGAESFLYGQATSLLAQRFNLLFGLDKFRIDPLTSSTGDLSSARVTVGKQLGRDLAVTYSYDPSETEEQVLELEWSISRSLILVLTQNGDGTYAVDARWEKAL